MKKKKFVLSVQLYEIQGVYIIIVITKKNILQIVHNKYNLFGILGFKTKRILLTVKLNIFSPTFCCKSGKFGFFG